MKQPKIVTLTPQEKKELIDHIQECSLNNDDKKATVELVTFYDDLMEKLKSSNITISKLQEMMLGFKSDKLKKMFQIQ
jgi:hypothetical protein